MTEATRSAPQARPRALVGWRLLALGYDLLANIALWMLASLLFTLAYQWSGHARTETLAPFAALQWLLWAVCWVISGVYAVASWRRGGQTLGMRPWRLQLEAIAGGRPSPAALWRRYAVGTLSLLALGDRKSVV